jgi:hypothetical protein
MGSKTGQTRGKTSDRTLIKQGLPTAEVAPDAWPTDDHELNSLILPIGLFQDPLFWKNGGHRVAKTKARPTILQKGLVCMHVLWMVGQMIERKVSGCPFTPLEIHTFVHIFCALVLYAVWFQKPKDLQILPLYLENHTRISLPKC